LPPLRTDATLATEPVHAHTQNLLNQTLSALQTQLGDKNMFTVDIPYPPLQADSVLVAQSNVTTTPPQSAKSAPTKPPKSPKIDYVLTSCKEYNDIPEESERAGYYTSLVSPTLAFATF
jgi:hypothetical protein